MKPPKMQDVQMREAFKSAEHSNVRGRVPGNALNQRRAATARL